VKTTDDPKKLLKALLANEALPFDAAAADAARAMAQAPETATREAVEALPEPLALAVLEATVKAKRVELAAALQESPVKGLAKGARRALYGLRSAGVAVPERPKPPAPEPAQAEAGEDDDELEWLPCWLSPPTGTGERGVLAVRPQKGGGLEVAQVVMSDEKGITSIQVAETNRSSYRRQVRELRSEDPIRALEIALEECKAIMGEAAALNLASGTALPQGAEQLLRHFSVSATQVPADLPAPLPEDERLAAQAASLHQEPEAQSWLPPEEQLKLLAQRIEVVMTSPLQLTQVQKQEQIHGVVRAAAAELFTPAFRKTYARRIWNLGDFLERVSRNDQAAVAKAEARRMFHDAGERPDRWEEALFEKVLALSQALQRGEPLPEPGSMPAPQQGEAEGAAPAVPGERKSPGGLILP
jgi:hypothetical protein